MKKMLTTTAAICFAATQATAGSLAEPVVEPPLAVPAASSSAGSWGGFGRCKQQPAAQPVTAVPRLVASKPLAAVPPKCGQHATTAGNVLVPLLIVGAIIGIAVAAGSNNK